MGEWTFFSNYGHVLTCLARDNGAKLRDVALEVGITERAVQKIVKDLQQEGYLAISKKGRRNHYQINRRKSLRHALQSHVKVGKLLTLLARGEPEPRAAGVPELKTSVPTPSEEIATQGRPSPAPEEPHETEKPEVKAEKPEERPDPLPQGSLF
jgi:biotin operon repressor